MAKWNLNIGGINLTSGSMGDTSAVDPETPFRILILGDFRGQTLDPTPLAARKPIQVDRDNLDEVLAQLAPSIQIACGPGQNEIAFREMDDFEPDRLYQRLSVFESLADLRSRLNQPTKFAAAAAEIKGWSAAAKIPDAAPPPVAMSGESLLAQMLGENPVIEETPETDWQRFLHRIVDPHLVARTDPRLPDFEAVLDEAASAQMRSILHDPAFQTVEAAWRGLFFLVRRLDTDASLKIFILPLSRAELNADLAAENLNTTALFQHLVQRTVGTPGAPPWAVIAGLFRFGATQGELEALGNLGRIAGLAGAPFFAEAHAALLGVPSLLRQADPRDWPAEPHELWNQLRQLPDAQNIGLVLPRLLLRLPYGKEGRSTEQFAFEEMPADSPHDNYLWGNPALACVYLLGRSFSQHGWNMHPGQLLDIDGLPLHIYEEDGERRPKPCAELVLSNRAIERMLELGIMPLLSYPGRDAVRLTRFQSIAGTALPGRWQ